MKGERGEGWCWIRGFRRQTTKKRRAAAPAGPHGERNARERGRAPRRSGSVSTATAGPREDVRRGRARRGALRVPSPAAENLLLPAGQGHRGPTPQMVGGTPAAGCLCLGAAGEQAGGDEGWSRHCALRTAAPVAAGSHLFILFLIFFSFIPPRPQPLNLKSPWYFPGTQTAPCEVWGVSPRLPLWAEIYFSFAAWLQGSSSPPRKGWRRLWLRMGGEKNYNWSE